MKSARAWIARFKDSDYGIPIALGITAFLMTLVPAILVEPLYPEGIPGMVFRGGPMGDIFRMGRYLLEGFFLVTATASLWSIYDSADKKELVAPALMGLVVGAGVLFIEIAPLPGVGTNTVESMAWEGKTYSLPPAADYVPAAPWVVWSIGVTWWSLSALLRKIRPSARE